MKPIFILILLYHYIIDVSSTALRCQSNCEGTTNITRWVGPTKPANTRQHPWIPAEFPTKFSGFCKLGCQLFFSEDPYNVTCKRSCDYSYRYEVTVQYSDYIEISRLECRDGCDIGLLVCQTGYYCTGGKMLPCPPGRFRESDMGADEVRSCIDCPIGRYRERDKGTSADTCELCPIGKYNDLTGADSINFCKRCPAGMTAEERGMGQCKCITPDSCDLTVNVNGNDTTYYSNNIDYFRETVPYIGRW